AALSMPCPPPLPTLLPYTTLFRSLLLTFQHRAGVSPYTSPYGLAETCVFDKQSLGPIHCGSPGREPYRAPLLPKLRGHFAEFLNESSLAHLRILILTTCVGLRYGHHKSS